MGSKPLRAMVQPGFQHGVKHQFLTWIEARLEFSSTFFQMRHLLKSEGLCLFPILQLMHSIVCVVGLGVSAAGLTLTTFVA